MRLFLSLNLAAYLIAFGASAEIDTHILNCVAQKTCDHDGNCSVSDRIITFHFTPIEVGRHGEGSYELSYDEVTSEARYLSGLGPIFWGVGQIEMNSLSFTANERALWLTTQIGEPPSSDILFLECERDF